MQFGDGKSIFFCAEIAVHEVYTGEVCFGGEFVGAGDFNHPVEHACAEMFVDVMSIEEGT